VTVLLDANVLIALLVDDHVHHSAAETWFAGLTEGFATCPVTQGSLLRLLIREGQPTAAAQAVLSGTTADQRHEFWPGDISYTEVPAQGNGEAGALFGTREEPVAVLCFTIAGGRTAALNLVAG
jgi:uncharacterized protein